MRGNLDVLREIYEAWNADPLGPRVFALLDDDFEYVNPEYALEPGTRRGHAGYRQVIANTRAAFVEFEHLPGQMVDLGDRVLCYATFRARSQPGMPVLEKAEQHLWTLRDGRAIRLEWFHDRGAAHRAAGLAP